MIFTTKAEYGVRLLVELGRQAPGQPVSLKAIAEAEGLPLAYLERIVALLQEGRPRREHARRARRLPAVARPPRRSRWTRSCWRSRAPIAPDGAASSTTPQAGRVLCSHVDDHGHGCATKLLWTRVQGGVIKALAQTTLAELVAFSERTQVPVAARTAPVAV